MIKSRKNGYAISVMAFFNLMFYFIESAWKCTLLRDSANRDLAESNIKKYKF